MAKREKVARPFKLRVRNKLFFLISQPKRTQKNF